MRMMQTQTMMRFLVMCLTRRCFTYWYDTGNRTEIAKKNDQSKRLGISRSQKLAYVSLQHARTALVPVQ